MIIKTQFLPPSPSHLSALFAEGAQSGTRPFHLIISRRGKGRREKGRKGLEN